MNWNPELTKWLEELADLYDLLERDSFRAKSLRKGSVVLRKLPYTVTRVEQLQGLRFIGDSMRAMVDEILTTGRLGRVEQLKADHKVRARLELRKVWGVGPSTVELLVSHGIYSVAQLRTPAGLRHLNSAQRIALEHFEDLNHRIPR